MMKGALSQLEKSAMKDQCEAGVKEMNDDRILPEPSKKISHDYVNF